MLVVSSLRYIGCKGVLGAVLLVLLVPVLAACPTNSQSKASHFPSSSTSVKCDLCKLPRAHRQIEEDGLGAGPRLFCLGQISSHAGVEHKNDSATVLFPAFAKR